MKRRRLHVPRMKRRWGHPTSRWRSVHERANYPRTPRGGFRCPGCVAAGWYEEGILPDPTRRLARTNALPGESVAIDLLVARFGGVYADGTTVLPPNNETGVTP